MYIYTIYYVETLHKYYLGSRMRRNVQRILRVSETICYIFRVIPTGLIDYRFHSHLIFIPRKRQRVNITYINVQQVKNTHLCTYMHCTGTFERLYSHCSVKYLEIFLDAQRGRVVWV